MKLRKFCQLTFCANWEKAIIINHDLIFAVRYPSKIYLSCQSKFEKSRHSRKSRTWI